MARAGLWPVGSGSVRCSSVGGDAVADELGVDPRPALGRVLELLEHENGARLAHDEAVAIGLERPARVLWVVVSLRERAHGAETGDPDPRDRRLAATGEHDVGAAEADRVEAVADRHRRGGAGGALGGERAFRAELDRDPGGAHVRDDRGDRERVDPVGAPLDQRLAGVLERLEAAHRGRDGDADPVALLLDLQPGVRLRLTRRRHDHLREPIHAPRLLVLDPLSRLEVLRLAGEGDREATRVERRDRAGRRLDLRRDAPSSTARRYPAASPRPAP